VQEEMKIFNPVFLAFLSVLALQSVSAEDVYSLHPYIVLQNANAEDEVLYAAGSTNENGALFARTDSDEVKIRKVRAYCDSQRDFVATGVSPCEETRSVGEFIDVVYGNSSSLTNVYREYFKTKSGFGGKVTFFVTIAANGEVTDISIESSTTNYPEFDNAIKNSVAAWKWKAVKNWRLKLVEHNGDYTGMASFWFKEEMLK
jgi:hypothetical protein